MITVPIAQVCYYCHSPAHVICSNKKVASSTLAELNELQTALEILAKTNIKNTILVSDNLPTTKLTCLASKMRISDSLTLQDTANDMINSQEDL